jgi:hypothetical protein
VTKVLSHLQQSKPEQDYRQPLKNYDDMVYLAQMSVGNQHLQGILDTGSYELLVFSTLCSTCGDAYWLFDPTWSSSLVVDEGIQIVHSFGSGDSLSQLAHDNVTIGPCHVEGQHFWEVIAAKIDVLETSSFQAIVGVGPYTTPTEIAASVLRQAEWLAKRLEDSLGYVPTAIQEKILADKRLLVEEPFLQRSDVRIFSVCLSRESGAGGYFVWNDTLPLTMPTLFSTIPVVGELSWGVSLTGVGFGNSDGAMARLGCADKCVAIVDSGTSLILGPGEMIDDVIALLGESNATCDDINAFPTLDFEFGDLRLSLPPEAYIGTFIGTLPSPWNEVARRAGMPPKYKGCELLMAKYDAVTQSGPLWILGMPFLRAFYTTFSMGVDANDKAGRSLRVAHATDDCEPEGISLAQRDVWQQRTLERRRPRTYNLSKFSIPRRLYHAGLHGFYFA